MSLPPDLFYERVLADLQYAVRNFRPTCSFDHHFIDTLSAQLAAPDVALPTGQTSTIRSSLTHLAKYTRERNFPLEVMEGPDAALHLEYSYWFHTLLLLVQELTFLQQSHFPVRHPLRLSVAQGQEGNSLLFHLDVNLWVPMRYFSLLGADYLQNWSRTPSTQQTRLLLGFLLHLLTVWGVQLHVEPDLGALEERHCRIRLLFRGAPLEERPAQTWQDVLRQYADWLAQGRRVAQYYYRPLGDHPRMPFLGRIGGIAYAFPQRPQLLLFAGVTAQCGRSTALRNVAWTLAQEQRVLWIDTPTEGQSTSNADSLVEPWQAERKALSKRLDRLPPWTGDPRLFGWAVRELAPGYDYVLIDCPALASAAMQSVQSVADLLILVGGLQPAEQVPLRQYMLAMYDQPSSETPLPHLQIPLRSLLLRSWELSAEQHEKLRSAYRSLGVQVSPLETVIGWDNAYQAATVKGQALLETGQPSPTLAEYQQLVQEIKWVLWQRA